MRVDPEIRRFLEALPTLAVGQGDDLKIETAHTRIWLSRATTADKAGTTGQIEIEMMRKSGEPGDEDRSITWEVTSSALARQFANDALRVAGYAGGGKI